VLIVGCSDGTTEGGGGASGAGGSAGSKGTATGVGGSAASAGTGGSGGTTQAVELTEAFDSSLPMPTTDCRSGFEESHGCISVSGTIDGQDIDVHCTDEEANGVYKNPDQFAISCQALVGSDTLEVQIRVPVLDAPGAFAFAVGEGVSGEPEVLIGLNGRGGDLLAGNVEGGAIHGEATYAAEVGFFTYDEIAGTFRLTLNDGASGCDPVFYECAPAQIHGTFYGRYASNLK